VDRSTGSSEPVGVSVRVSFERQFQALGSARGAREPQNYAGWQLWSLDVSSGHWMSALVTRCQLAPAEELLKLS
jgi:hypothetical protein